MARQRQSRRLLDSYRKATSKAAKPPTVSMIVGGVKYKAGNAPAPVCPVGAVRRTPLARPV